VGEQEGEDVEGKAPEAASKRPQEDPSPSIRLFFPSDQICTQECWLVQRLIFNNGIDEHTFF